MEGTIYQRLGRNLAEQRKRAELTQEQLGERVVLSRTSIVNIEAGRQRVAVHRLYAFAEALSISPHDLLPASDDIRPDPQEWVEIVKDELAKDELEGGF